MTKVKLFESIEEAFKIVPKGQIRLLKIDDKMIALANVNHHLKAVSNGCPHLGHPLHQGNLTPFGEIVCPLHSYRFNLTTGDEIDNRCPAVTVFSVFMEQNVVYIEI